MCTPQISLLSQIIIKEAPAKFFKTITNHFLIESKLYKTFRYFNNTYYIFVNDLKFANLQHKNAYFYVQHTRILLDLYLFS